MTNHVHFIALPEREDSICRTFHRTNGMYSSKFNKKNGFVGHLWQERPFSCVLSEGHLWKAIRYVETNPVRAGLVTLAEHYPWSSAPAHCNGTVDPLLDPDWSPLEVIPNWSEWLKLSDDDDFASLIRKRTLTGQPCGDKDFVDEMERTTGRSLSPGKRGRKPKAVSTGNPLFPLDEDPIVD
jgi:putative transposase